ncbi:hypothetical protein MSAN_00644500 [Mycena sanguinolenta]|uniref:Uncharacterized protein n=1 Tax=Mycena sanguinolenta TaxID=230812 RepID=A0A8H6Z3G6_9AGAR|nr:hypothetical protein MSAN_00644500 [Mycena sanguinolenta]
MPRNCCCVQMHARLRPRLRRGTRLLTAESYVSGFVSCSSKPWTFRRSTTYDGARNARARAMRMPWFSEIKIQTAAAAKVSPFLHTPPPPLTALFYASRAQSNGKTRALKSPDLVACHGSSHRVSFSALRVIGRPQVKDVETECDVDDDGTSVMLSIPPIPGPWSCICISTARLCVVASKVERTHRTGAHPREHPRESTRLELASMKRSAATRPK